MAEEAGDTLSGDTMHMQGGRTDFPTTRWTLVVAAGDPARKESRAALTSLCENYWYPLYAYARRRGHSSDEAQDLTQEFFLRILEGRYLDRVDREKGRFRSFLLTSLKFFLADEGDRRGAQKRGGAALLPFELSSGEERYQREPVHNETPERIFERRWAHSLLDKVMARLRDEFQNVRMAAPPGFHGGQLQFLTEKIPAHRGKEGKKSGRLQNAAADGVGDSHVAAANGLQQSRHSQVGIRQ